MPSELNFIFVFLCMCILNLANVLCFTGVGWNLSQPQRSGGPLAQLVEWASLVQRLCPCYSTPGLSPSLGPFAASPYPASCFPWSLKLSYQYKGPKKQECISKKGPQRSFATLIHLNSYCKMDTVIRLITMKP